MPYISQAGQILPQAAPLVSAFRGEIDAASGVLAVCPVSGWAGFTRAEVVCLAAYRERLAPRSVTLRSDAVWASVVVGEWYAWPFAVHEAAELDALVSGGVNPFDADAFDPDRLRDDERFAEAHLRATALELQFLRAWGKAVGRDIPEIAIETANPFRSPAPRTHAHLLRELTTRFAWAGPLPEQVEAARDLWTLLRETK